MEEILTLYQELRGLFPANDLLTEFPQRVHRIIQETIDRIPDETRVAIRPAGLETQSILGVFDFSEKNVIGILDQKYYGDVFCGYPCFVIDKFPTQAYDCVIIVSFYYRQEIKEELEMLHIPYIDLYDELEKQGIQPLPHFHVGRTHDFQIAVNHYYLRYLQSETRPQREAALRELLQIAVECKDFTLISNIYQDCRGENREFSLLKSVWEKSEHLLDRIRDKLQKRKQKDIILFWTDSVPYSMLHYMPETMELSKQGTFFQRAYTHTPYTNPTMRAIFRNMLPIDDFPQDQEKIDSRNSSMIQFIENKGYKIRYIGRPAGAMGKEHLINGYLTSCNMTWWKGIIDLLQSPESCIYIFHFFESHPPFYVPGLKESVNINKAPRTQLEVQIKAAFGYLDQCLHLYHKLLGNKTQIFFSDHGIHFPEEERWSEVKLHPYCFAVGENIPRITVTQFFPYKNFEKFLRWLLDPTHFSLDDVYTDEVIFQDIDFYDQKHVTYLIRENEAKTGLAYRGVLNYDYKYVINALGEEFFYQRHEDGSEKLVPLEDPAVRDELRSKAGTKFLDINQYDKFRYTRRLYDFLKQNEK